MASTLAVDTGREHGGIVLSDSPHQGATAPDKAISESAHVALKEVGELVFGAADLGVSPDDADALAITFAYPYLEEAFSMSKQPGHNGGPPLEDAGDSYAEANPYAQVTSSKFNPLRVQ